MKSINETLTPAADPEAAPSYTPDDPTLVARILLDQWATATGEDTVRRWRGRTWSWEGQSYSEVKQDAFRNRVQLAMQPYYEQNVFDRHGNVVHVTPHRVNAVIAAINSQVAVDDAIEQPCLLDNLGAPLDLPGVRHGFLAFENGILLLDRTLAGLPTLFPLHPRWFSQVVLPYAYDNNATCPQWTQFLAEMFEGDAEAQKFAQEYRMHTNPARTFLSDAYEVGAGRLPVTEVYGDYCAFATELGAEPVSAHAFGLEVSSAFGKAVKRKRLGQGNPRPYVYVGLQRTSVRPGEVEDELNMEREELGGESEAQDGMDAGTYLLIEGDTTGDSVEWGE